MKHARNKHSKTESSLKRRESVTHERSRSDASRKAQESVSDSRVRARAAVEERKKQKKKKKRSQLTAKLCSALVILICVGTVILLGVGAGMYAAVSQEIDDLDMDGIANNFSSIVYANDENGNSHEIESLHSDGNRQWIESDKIPDIAKEAAIAIEDERFYKHRGVDIKRTAGAVIGWVQSKITGKSPSYGGSTITQQVIKNITNEKDKTVTRKIKEMMRAIAFEKRFTKDEILTMYLNIVYFGNQCYGIEPASQIYFSKNAGDLTLPQAAMIVGTTQAPSRFDPFRKPDDALAKRNTVLMKMHELGKISQEEYDEASASPLGVNTKYKAMHSRVYSYFVDQVINDVINDLQSEKGYSEQFATQQVFSGGLKIYTTMDSKIQSAIEEVYTNTANFPGASRGIQSSMVIIDPKTGQIKGLAGGIGTKTESRGLNRATQSTRQPGSSIKPIAVYAPALETGKITAATVVKDEKITIGDWSPKNSYSGFKGNMSIRKAIEISANIPAVKTLQSSGIGNAFDFMTNKMHFSTLTDSDKNLSALALGGMTKGVSTKEMAAAYSIFPNKGVYIEPHTYTKVIDSTGKVLLEKNPEETKVLSEANAFIMTDFLKDVVNGSAGTGRNARLSNMATYGKTGTSNDNNDKWFCGFTAYYTGAVWYGYDSNRSVGSSNVATQIWKKVMQKVHDGYDNVKIEAPSSVTAVSLCQNTGKLSSEGCSYAKTDYFAKSTLPSKYCKNSHKSGATDDAEASPSPSASPEVPEETDSAAENTAEPSDSNTSGGDTSASPKPSASAAPDATPKPATPKPTVPPATPKPATPKPATPAPEQIERPAAN